MNQTISKQTENLQELQAIPYLIQNEEVAEGM